MRVITGSARGMKLETLEGNDVRPTTDKVKEAIFSMIQFEIEGRMVLDLFAGSGQLGIEALSRGAAKAVFVDASRQSVEVVRRNLQKTGLEKLASVASMDYKMYLNGLRETIDIAFLDPPYHKKIQPVALELLAPKMSKGGVIICETATDEILPDSVGDFIKYKNSRYGKIAVTVYRHKDVI